MKPTAALIPFCLLLLPVHGHAQEPQLPESGNSAVLPGVENLGESLLISEILAVDAAPMAEPVGEPLAPISEYAAGRRGRWRVAPHLRVKGTYDDNIFIQPDNEIADYILTVAPGLGAGFWDSEEERELYWDRLRAPTLIERSRGNFLAVDYTAILLGFAKTTSQNTLDHDARLDGRWTRGRLTINGGLRFESKSEANADIGGRVRRQTASAALSSTYEVSPKTSLEVAFFAMHNDPEDYVRTMEWRGEAALDYAVAPSVRLGLGASAGVIETEDSANSVFERIFARATYSLSEKLETVFRAGVEFRQSEGEAGDRVNPIFEASALWKPTVGRRVLFESYRRVETSSFTPDQDITRTGVGLTLQQAVRGGLHLRLEAGAYLADYTATQGDESREDRVYFIRPGIFYSFAAWGNLGVSYEWRRDCSTRRSSSFENNLTSVDVELLY